MKILIKLCHWFIMLFYLVFIYYGIKVLFFSSLPDNVIEDKEVTSLMKMAKTNFLLYFSLWGVALQVIYFLLVSILEVVDTVPFLKQMTSLRKQADNIRKHLFVSLVFPITLCAGVTFWIVYAYDREQIYPSGLDKIIQPWINHSIHTIPPVLVFIHMFLADLTGISTPLCLKLLLCFNVLYSTCFIWSGLVYGNWIYLICQAMGAKKLAIVLSVCNLSTGIYFAIGRLLPSYIKSINKHKENNTRKVK